jgi:hypothetical protein
VAAGPNVAPQKLNTNKYISGRTGVGDTAAHQSRGNPPHVESDP